MNTALASRTSCSSRPRWSHNAMNDVQGCMAVYFGIQDMQKEVA